MQMQEQLLLMSRYNTWMNQRLYETVQTLSPEEFFQDRKAFFRSVCGTLNHVAVADTIWLKRFANHLTNHAALDPVRELEMPPALDHILFNDVAALTKYRCFLDDVIERWVASLSEADLDSVMQYGNMKGVKAKKLLGQVLLHFFNHQTHHRGQVTSLLSQCDRDMGATDLLLLIPNIEAV